MNKPKIQLTVEFDKKYVLVNGSVTENEEIISISARFLSSRAFRELQQLAVHYARQQHKKDGKMLKRLSTRGRAKGK